MTSDDPPAGGRRRTAARDRRRGSAAAPPFAAPDRGRASARRLVSRVVCIGAAGVRDARLRVPVRLAGQRIAEDARRCVLERLFTPPARTSRTTATSWQVAPVANWFLNSAIVCVLAAVDGDDQLGLVAFGFAYFRFPGRNLLFGLVLASMMLPGAVLMIPNFLIWNALGQVNSPLFTPLWAGNLFGVGVLHLPASPVLPGPAARAVRGGPGRRRELSADVLERRGAADTGGAHRGVHLRAQGELDRPREAADLHAGHRRCSPSRVGLKSLVDLFNPHDGGEGEFQLVMAASVIVTLPDDPRVLPRPAVLHRGHRDHGLEGLIRPGTLPRRAAYHLER